MSFRKSLDANRAQVVEVNAREARERKVVRAERRADVLARDISDMEQKIEAATKDGDVELLAALLPRLDVLQRIHAVAVAEPDPASRARAAFDKERRDLLHARKAILDRINRVKRDRTNLRPSISEIEREMQSFGPTPARQARLASLKAIRKKYDDDLQGVEQLESSDY